MAGDAPQAAALVAGVGLRVGRPLERVGSRHLAGRDLPGVAEQVVAPPHGAWAHGELRADLRGVGIEDADRAERLAGDHLIDHVLDARAVRIGKVDVDAGLRQAVVGRTATSPQVSVGSVGVAEEARDVAGMLGRDLDAQRRVVLPRSGRRVAPLLEQRGVVPEDVLCLVIAEAADLVVDVARGVGRGRVALQEVREERAQVTRVVDLRAGRPGDVVVGGEEDGVRPAAARLVEQHELLLQVRAADVALDRVDGDRDLGMRLLEGVGRRDARGVDPDRDRAAGIRGVGVRVDVGRRARGRGSCCRTPGRSAGCRGARRRTARGHHKEAYAPCRQHATPAAP